MSEWHRLEGETFRADRWAVLLSRGRGLIPEEWEAVKRQAAREGLLCMAAGTLSLWSARDLAGFLARAGVEPWPNG